MERVYKKYEDFDNAVKSFREDKKDYADEIKEIEKAKIELAEVTESTNKKIAELDIKTKALAEKMIALKDREAKFDKKRDELKSIISGKAIKDILK